MTDPLSLDRLQQVLPSLRDVAEVVRRNGSLSHNDLRLLLSGGTDEEWALTELQSWAKILALIRGLGDPHRCDLAVRALMLRGVPEAPALLAVNIVAPHASKQPPVPTSSLQAVSLPIKVNREAIGFGDLKPGQQVRATLKVSGGPGQAFATSDLVSVEPAMFGPGETALTVRVSGGLDGQILFSTLVLDSGTQRVNVELTARWNAGIQSPVVPRVAVPVLPLTVSVPPIMRPSPKRRLIGVLGLAAGVSGLLWWHAEAVHDPIPAQPGITSLLAKPVTAAPVVVPPGSAEKETAAGHLQATSNADIATLYYRNVAGVTQSADCSPDSDDLRISAGRYMVRIEGIKGKLIARERAVFIRAGQTTYIGPD